jgi:DNA polymerase-3 subunit gamma/tau
MLFGEEELTRFLQIMLRTANELTYRQEQRFHLELGVLKLVHLQRLLPVEELLLQLGGATPARTVSAPQAPRALPSTPARTAPATPTSRPATPAPSAAPSPAKVAAPAFSPFERDAERKHAPAAPRAATAAVLEASPAPSPAAASAFPAPKEPEAEPVLSAIPTAAPAPLVTPRPVEPAAPVVAESLAAPAPAAPEPAPTGTLDLDAMRNAACDALAAAGHTTAATLVGAGEWTETPDAVRVEVAAKKVMLGLTINPEADKIARAAMRPFAGQPPRPVQWVPSENGTRQKSADRPAPTGSVQAVALENPLVQQAKQLFGAEVRSVVDLRDKR